MDVIEGLVIEQPLDNLLIGEAFDSVELVCECAFVKVAGDADVERAREAALDVNGVCLLCARHGSGPSTPTAFTS